MAEREQALRRQKKEAERARRQREREIEEARTAAMRTATEQRRQQEQRSLARIEATSRPCPGCGWAIEKSTGCDHMTCELTHLARVYAHPGLPRPGSGLIRAPPNPGATTSRETVFCVTY